MHFQCPIITQAFLFLFQDKSYFVGIIFKAYREMRNNTGGLSMGTKVINAVVSPCPGDELQDPVEMSFEKNIVSYSITFLLQSVDISAARYT